MTSARIRSSVSSSVTRRPRASRYSKPRPRRRDARSRRTRSSHAAGDPCRRRSLHGDAQTRLRLALRAGTFRRDASAHARPRRVLGRRPPPARRALREAPRHARDRRAGRVLARRHRRAPRQAHVLRRRRPARARPAEAHRPARLATSPRPARSCRPARATASSSARAFASGSSRRRPRSSTTSTTSRFCTPDPERTAAAFERYGLQRASLGSVEVGGARLVFVHGEPEPTERPLLNHLGLLVESAEAHRRRAESLGLEVE